MGSHANTSEVITLTPVLRARRAGKGEDLWILEQPRKRPPKGYWQPIGRAMRAEELVEAARRIIEEAEK